MEKTQHEAKILEQIKGLTSSLGWLITQDIRETISTSNFQKNLIEISERKKERNDNNFSLSSVTKLLFSNLKKATDRIF